MRQLLCGFLLCLRVGVRGGVCRFGAGVWVRGVCPLVGLAWRLLAIGSAGTVFQPLF